MGNSEKAVLKTLLYSDIFSFPLTLDEIVTFLISDKTCNKKTVERALLKMSPIIEAENGYYCVKGRKEIIRERIKKKRFSNKKYALSARFCKILSRIPSVLFIGISGGVAARNAEKNDDIDLFIITKKNTLWITRLCILLVLELYGVRRIREAELIENKICINMLLEEPKLYFSKKRQNIYTAREIAQLVPLFDRDKTYNAFLRANSWTKEYLANMSGKRVLVQQRSNSPHRFFQKILMVLNPFTKQLQMAIIRKHITTEEVSDTLLAFHPKDYAVSTLRAFKKRIQQAEKLYNIHLHI